MEMERKWKGTEYKQKQNGTGTERNGNRTEQKQNGTETAQKWPRMGSKQTHLQPYWYFDKYKVSWKKVSCFVTACVSLFF